MRSGGILDSNACEKGAHFIALCDADDIWLADKLKYQLEHFPMVDAFAQKVGGEWKTFSTSESLDTIAALAWGLHLAGIREGDRVADVTETWPRSLPLKD